MIGRSYMDLGQWRPARSCLEHAVDLARQDSDAITEAGAQYDLGLLELQAERPSRAARLLQRALAGARRARPGEQGDHRVDREGSRLQGSRCVG